MKSVLNLVLIADSQSTENSVKIPLKIVDDRSFCVELWPKQVLHRSSIQCRILRVWTLVYYILCLTKKKTMAANPRRYLFEKCFKSRVDIVER